jgi:hypothetical protein
MEKEQLDELMAQLDGVSEMIARIREMVPADAAVEEAESIDEATADEEVAGDTDASLAPADDKQVKKAAAVAMLKRSL